MTSPWEQEQLQHAIAEEVAAVVYAETHERLRTVEVGSGVASGPTSTGSTVPEQARSERTPDPARVLPTVVVGVDGSPASDSALAWAAAEAVDHGARVVLVRVEEGLGDLPVPTDTWHRREQELRELAASLRDTHPGLDDVTSELREGAPGPVLVARAADADLLVVGTHGKGAFSRAVLGSASSYCAVHAVVPTVVVPQGWPPSGRAR